MPEGVDPAPLVDFCNQNSPRAQPLISRSPAATSKVALLRAVQVAPPRQLFQARPLRACPWSMPSNRALADPVYPSSASTRLASLATCKQVAGPVRASWRYQPSFHGSGAVRAWRMTPPVQGTPKGARSGSFAPTRSTRAPPVVGSWQRRLESPAPSSIPPRRPSSRRTCQGPPHPSLREEERDPPHPRCLPSMSCPRARELDCPQAVDNLWMEPGASRTLARSPRP